MTQPRAEDSMKDPSQRADGTNAILSQILDTDKQILATANKQLAATLSLQDTLGKLGAGLIVMGAIVKDISESNKAILKVSMDSKVLLKEISDAITGGTDGSSRFSVRVQQLASRIAEEVASRMKK